MSIVKTVEAKYVFLDIVKYSKRHVEAQCDIIENLNKIVAETIACINIENKVKYIPTGDGMCIAILNTNEPFDIHLQVALKILESLQKYNDSQQDNARKFEVRIGINGNIDNLVTDINGDENVAGAGINYSQRVMSFADGGNILIGEPIFNCLSQREKYVDSFTKFHAVVKHGVEIDVYQYANKEISYLNNDVPKAFKIEKKTVPGLTKVVAYFIALLIKDSDSIKKILNSGTERSYSLTIALYMLAVQHEDNSNRNEYEQVTDYLPNGVERTVETLQEYYYKNDFFINSHLCKYIGSEIEKYGYCFERGFFGIHFPKSFQVSTEGIKKLKEEYPYVVKEFNIE